jgi:hypothetical protein
MLGHFFITEDRKTRDTVPLSVHRRANVPWRNREMLMYIIHRTQKQRWSKLCRICSCYTVKLSYKRAISETVQNRSMTPTGGEI